MSPKESEILNSKPQNLMEESTKDYSYDPNGFISARKTTPSQSSSSKSVQIVAGRVYLPTVRVDIHDQISIINAALQIIFHNEPQHITDDEFQSRLQVNKVEGGMTNSLFRISGINTPNKEYNSILVRVFGAEGMIDRDVETCTFAALADRNIAPRYYGRFQNGRVEGWLDNYKPLALPDFQKKETYLEIAMKMAELHAGFVVPDELKMFHDEKEPGLWNQLFSWMKQAQEITEYNTATDNERASSLLDLEVLEQECNWVKSIVSQDAKVGFCHNDLLPANIMKHETSGDVKFIDFEYGGVNYIAFDIANHFNEWAGGIENNEGRTDYSLFPSKEQQIEFVKTYLQTASTNSKNDDNIVDENTLSSMMIEIEVFLLANHLYWGLWAVNQAAIEGTNEFDYLAYGVNRFNRYFETKYDKESLV